MSTNDSATTGHTSAPWTAATLCRSSVQSAGRRGLPAAAGEGLGKSTMSQEIEAAVASHPLFKWMGSQARTTVLEASRSVRFRPGRTFIKEGTPAEDVYCLLTGAVRVAHEGPDGTELLAKLFRAPAFFGEMEVLTGSRFIESVTTLEPSVVLMVPGAVFEHLLQTEHTLSLALVRDLAARLLIAGLNEKAVAFHNVEARLASLLLDYVSYFGEETERGIRISIPLTQDGMARDLAVSRKSLTRALKNLRQAGIICKRTARYHVRDMQGLRARSTGIPGVTYRLRDVQFDPQ